MRRAPLDFQTRRVRKQAPAYVLSRGFGVYGVSPAELEHETADVQDVAFLQNTTSIESFFVDERLAAKRRCDVAVTAAGNRHRN